MQVEGSCERKGHHHSSLTAPLALSLKTVQSLSLFTASFSQPPPACWSGGLQQKNRSMDFVNTLLLREHQDNCRLLGEAPKHAKSYTTVTLSEQLRFHLVCFPMYALFMKISLFILLLPKTDSLVLIFVNPQKYSAMGLWQFENKKPSLQCTKPPISPVHLLEAVITQPTAASEL